MARRKTLFETEAAQRFRQMVRPAMFGRIGKGEALLTMRMADALNDWLYELIRRTMQATAMSDEHAEVLQQLRSGVRVVGRISMRRLEGRIDTYPWIFPHEYGGTLRPENARALTIPIFYGLRSDGRPKFRSANSWRRFGSFIYTPQGSERSYIAYKAANRDLRILYVLVDEVEIPARLGLNRMADSMISNLINEWARIFVYYGGLLGMTNPWTDRD